MAAANRNDIYVLREVVKKLIPMLVQRNIKVTQMGTEAYVRADTRTHQPVSINIPAINDDADADFVRAIQGFLDHEVAHVLFTDFSLYGCDPRKSSKKSSQKSKERFINMHNIIEDTMIERLVVEEFPGSVKNLHSVREYFLDKIIVPALKSVDKKNQNEQFLLLLVVIMRALAGHQEMQEFMDNNNYWDNSIIKQFIAMIKPETKLLLKNCRTTKETAQIAADILDILDAKGETSETGSADIKAAPDAKNEEQTEETDEGDGKGESKDKDKPDEKGEDKSDEKGEGGTSSEKEDKDKDDKSDDKGEGKGGDSSEDSAEDEDKDEGEDKSKGKGKGKSKGEDEDESDGESDDKDEDKSSSGSSSGSENDDEDKEDGEDDSKSGSSNDATDDSDSSDGADGENSDKGSFNNSDDDEQDTTVDEKSDETSHSDGYRTEGGEGNEIGDLRDKNDRENKNNGVGGGQERRSIFDVPDSALEAADMSAKIAIKISQASRKLADESEYTVFSRDYDRIEPLKLPAEINSEWVVIMQNKVMQMVGLMQKSLERSLASRNFVANIPGFKRGRLHAPSLYKLVTNDPRIFTHREEAKANNTVVSLLIDNSGSMSGQKMRIAMLSAYALSETLERLHIKHEVIGFTTYDDAKVERALTQERDKQYEMSKSDPGYDRFWPIAMPIYKDFNERINAVVRQRIAYAMFAQKDLSENIDGESLLYEVDRIMKQPEKRKVIIVLSDGQPAGCYNAGPHLAYVTDKIQREKQVELVGIGILDDSVRDYYKNYFVLDDVNDLPARVMGELRRILIG